MPMLVHMVMPVVVAMGARAAMAVVVPQDGLQETGRHQKVTRGHPQEPASASQGSARHSGCCPTGVPHKTGCTRHHEDVAGHARQRHNEHDCSGGVSRGGQ